MLTAAERAALIAAEDVLERVMMALPAHAKLKINLTCQHHADFRPAAAITYCITSGDSIGPHCHGFRLLDCLFQLSERQQPDA